MLHILKWIGDYLQKLLNAGDHTADVALLCYLATVVADLFWLSHGVYKGKGFTDGWNQNFLTLAGLVGFAKVNGTWATRMREKDNAQNQNPGGQP